MKYILTWSDAYNDPLYGWSFPHFEAAGCEEARCELTSNRSLLGRGQADQASDCKHKVITVLAMIKQSQSSFSPL